MLQFFFQNIKNNDFSMQLPLSRKIYIYIYGPFIQGITEKILKNISKQKWDSYFGTPKKERPIF